MSRPFDVRFIDTMVPHHEMGIEMAKIAVERAEHDDLKPFAAKIIATQESEIARMEKWRRTWVGSDSAPPEDGEAGRAGEEMGQSMASGGMDMKEQAESLRKADPFDKAFLEAMVPHHEAAIEMARPAQERAEHDELRELARAIVEAQTSDIDRMKGWLRTWF